MKEKAYGCLLGNLIESRIAWHPVRGLCYWLAGLASIRSVKPIGQRGCVAEGQVTRRGGESWPVAGDVCFSLLLLVGLLAAVLIKVGTICFTEVVLLT